MHRSGLLALGAPELARDHLTMNFIAEQELQEVSRSECLALLASVTTGRLAVTRKAMPVIVPVRIQLVDSEVAIESLLGDTLPLTAGSVVALEAGTIGDRTPGWTVQVCGFLVAGGLPISANSLDGVAGARFHISLDSISAVNGWRADTAVR